MVARYDLLVDRILVMDVKHAQNDDAYFVFEDTLKEVMMFWSRDEWLVDKVSQPFDLMQSHRSRRDGSVKLEKGMQIMVPCSCRVLIF